MPSLMDYYRPPGGDVTSMPEIIEADIAVGSQRARTDAATATRRSTYDFSQRILPQFQGQTAAAGQHYGSARARDEGGLARNFLEGQFDIQQGLQRQLDDFDRRRLYAGIGLVA